jgi:hypothetical protein
MADPRKIVDFTLIGQKRATLAYGNTIVHDDLDPEKYKGRSVKISADNQIQLCGDGDFIFGFISLTEKDGFCSVVWDGVVENAHKGDGATVTVGSGVVGALGPAGALGYIKNAAGFAGNIASLDGNAATNVAVTVTGSAGRGYVLNDNDADNIVVMLSR